MSKPKLFISDVDFARLNALVESVKRFFHRDHEHLGVLEEELNRAEVVATERLPANVVTMNSRIRLTDLDAGTQTIYTLSFPGDADITRNRLSVLAPIGAAILGYRVGAVIQAQVPGGKKRLKIEEVSYPTLSKAA